ncbi:MAG TPA: hypothetical protein VJ997_14055, partial [Longimicrobiales bacterium]|nr:hypothetical protein [Longimicrobiales bacterium]
MSLLRPSALLNLDGQELTSAEAAALLITVSLSVGTEHDGVEILAWPDSKLSAAGPGSTLEVSLGHAGEEELVWTGEVRSVVQSPEGLALEGLAPSYALSRQYRSQTFLKQTAGDIARDLAGEIDVGEVGADVELEAYAVDDRRSIWAHLHELARLTGSEVGSDPEGGLRFVPPREGSADVKVRYGADLLRWELSAAAAGTPAAVAALGSASEEGAEKWHWLRHDPVPSAGDSPTSVVATFRTRDAADALAERLAGSAARAAMSGEVTIVGRPEVRPGDLLEVQDLSPDPGILRVL